MAAGRPSLAIDTATSLAVVALGEPSGALRRDLAWTAGYRHGEELLGRIVELLGAEGLRQDDLGAIVVGTGPGAFTGLRIGLATAKTLAHELEIPIVGVSTAEALAHAATADVDGGLISVLLPAGPSGIVVTDVRGRDVAQPRLVTRGADLGLDAGATVLAVDLDGRATPEALALGSRARDRLGASLLELGAARLERGDHDDVARLVPEYVSLPRGVASATGEMAWSLDRP
jgi:tRNA threonylcarbamoyl adenosine modification protein YeaZ